MLQSLAALTASRKFWVGTLTVAAIVAGTALAALGKITTSQLIATIAGISGVGMSVIGSIAWEDSAQKSSPSTVNNNSTTTAVTTAEKGTTP